MTFFPRDGLKLCDKSYPRALITHNVHRFGRRAYGVMEGFFGASTKVPFHFIYFFDFFIGGGGGYCRPPSVGLAGSQFLEWKGRSSSSPTNLQGLKIVTLPDHNGDGIENIANQIMV